MSRIALYSAFVLLFSAGSLAAQEKPADSAAWPPVIARKLPPAGKAISEEAKTQLTNKLANLRRNFLTDASVEVASAGDLADFEILLKAVDYALRHGEFFDAKKDVERAQAVLELAERRFGELSASRESGTSPTGISVRGFRSRLDGSFQPYGLIVPEGLDISKPVPLYVWMHGRGDTSCDLQFVSQFMGTKAPGPLQPKDALVIHPFGRYCNGWKSAGEIDVLEAIEDVKRRFQIDDNRIVLAGFSMGGAGAWHMGAHYADHWCAVHAGAGFVDVRRYQNITPDKLPPWYEQTLWGLYDVPDYRRNFLNVPVIAYSGEDDKQKAAADIMEAELAKEGYKLPHFIGPKMGHKYHPEVLLDVQKKIAEAVAKGRDEFPKKVSLQTKTLRYNEMFWVSAYRLKKHWEEARIDAERTDDGVVVSTVNVTMFRLHVPVSARNQGARFAAESKVVVDGQTVTVPQETDGVNLSASATGTWSIGYPEGDPVHPLVKRPGVQGPIDDAFMSPFAVIWPHTDGGESAIDRWVEFEADHFADRWRMLMRGETRTAITVGDPAKINRNYVLWGTPKTNPAIAAILAKLPIKWTDETVGMGDLEFDAAKVVPVLIYPNPSNPQHYIVINSGLTFREAHDRTNSLQNPKLGDWAFIDVTQPPTDEFPGKVLASGFFDENWRYVPQKK